MDFTQTHRINMPAAPARVIRAARGNFQAAGLAFVDQVEFQLHAQRRAKAGGGVALQHARQHTARVEEEMAAVRLKHGQHRLAGRTLRPAHAGDGMRHGGAQAIRVAGVERDAALHYVAAPDIQQKSRARHGHAGAEQGFRLVRLHPFAARHAVHVNDKRLDIFSLRHQRQFGIAVRNGHDATSCFTFS